MVFMEIWVKVFALQSGGFSASCVLIHWTSTCESERKVTLEMSRLSATNVARAKVAASAMKTECIPEA